MPPSSWWKVQYIVGSLMTPIVLVTLQNTQLCLLHSFIYDSTSRYYNLSSYNEFWPSHILPRSGPLMSSASNAGSRLWLTWLLFATDLTIHSLVF
jgi:hypothetical protein